MRSKLFFILTFCILFLLSCKKETYYMDMHYDYYPTTKGTFQVYDVVERTHLSNGQMTEVIYQLKTVIGDTFVDNVGRVNHEFKRFKRATSADEWLFSDLWVTYLNQDKMELVEENERKVKLVFPFSKSSNWNAHAYTTLEELNCSYYDFFIPEIINNLTFDKTTKVLQEDEFNLIMYRNKYEVYAKGVGLVKKHYQHYDINNFDTTNIITGKAIYYTIASYGVE